MTAAWGRADDLGRGQGGAAPGDRLRVEDDGDSQCLSRALCKPKMEELLIRNPEDKSHDENVFEREAPAGSEHSPGCGEDSVRLSQGVTPAK